MFLLQDQPGGQIFALGKALFVIPKADSALHQHNGLAEGFSEKKKETESIISPVQQ